ncbi:MAG TPA: wax ester/triacylglycerol synthase domain-containing protein [Steroidobacteraceae bacterium]|nr:wax ester/triacylglycerol synthase domain-containing protein [Steroidobacteraceae bacterium]
MPTPRMSSIDQAFFLLETVQRPMNVGVLTIVAPRPVKRGKPSDALVRRMLRCPVGPPFDCRLAPGGLPQLETLSHVDPAEQLYRHELPAGSDLQALFARVCDIHSRRLDRTRPLWEMHVFDGLARGRVALYFKTHHGLLDGLGFLQVIRGSVSSRSGGRTPQAIWRGLPETSSGKSTAPAAVQRPAAATPFERVESVLGVARTARDMVRLFWHLGRRELGLGAGMSAPFVSTPQVFKTPPSPNRVMGHCVLPLERVRSVAAAADAKVNDVVLATVDLALSHYLEERGVRPTKPLVADMPVALHDQAGAGNRITILQVPMGRPGGTPLQRLQDVVRETRTVKGEVRALSPDALYAYSILEHAVASAIETLDLGEMPMLANAVVSNPTGLDAPLYFNGLRVELALPVSVVAHHQVLNVTVSNYGSDLNVTFIALREALPDVQRLADGTARALLELQRAVKRPAARPKRRRTVAVRPSRPATAAGRPTLH